MTPNKPGVYQIQSVINSKRYVGSAVNLRRRKIIHFSLLKKQDHFNIHLKNHYNKYGKADLQFSILEYCVKEKLIEREQYYIDTLKPEFNILPTAGSWLGVKHSEETKRKMSKTQKGKIVSEETKRKIRESNIGKKLTEKTKRKISEAGIGRKHSEETKKKIRESGTGLKRTEETKRKIRESWKNREPCSEETKRKMSVAQSGKNNAMYGKHHTEDSNQKNREAHTGIKQSKETIKKRVKKNTGKKRTEEIKRKNSIAMKALWKTPEYRRNRKLINTNFN